MVLNFRGDLRIAKWEKPDIVEVISQAETPPGRILVLANSGTAATVEKRRLRFFIQRAGNPLSVPSTPVPPTGSTAEPLCDFLRRILPRVSTRSVSLLLKRFDYKREGIRS